MIVTAARAFDPQPVLARIVARPERHARFANTLSLLEYVGARKILKSQPAAAFTAELLAHVAEETRHALTLKKLALKLDAALTSYRPEHLQSGPAARSYMQAVDKQAQADLMLHAGRLTVEEADRRIWINYLYTTLLVEERAARFYPAYAELLAPLGHAALIRGILREEESHLRQVVDHLRRDDPDGEARLARLRHIEETAFAGWFSVLEQEAA